MDKILQNYTGALFVLLILAVVVVSGCTGGSEEKAGEELKFDVMYTGYHAPFSEKKFIVIQNEREFMELMNKLGLNLKPPDFEKYTVIALFMGEQRTGGYSITVDRIVRAGDVVRVYVKNSVPSDTCIVIQQITRPFQIVKVEKIAEKIEFVENTQEVKC